MEKMTITEALAEIKTIQKRVDKKRAFVLQYLFHDKRLADPHQKEGGSFVVVQRERQSIDDLLDRLVQLRLAINTTNANNFITIEGETRTIAEWIVWKREIAPVLQSFLQNLSGSINKGRQDITRSGRAVQSAEAKDVGQNDVIVNINENTLGEEIEHLELVLGALDGQLSLKNATLFVEL